MKNIFFLLLIITLISCNQQFHFKEGDLLFQDLDTSPLCDAIGKKVQSGEFGAEMQVSLVNDGPVTILIDTKNKQ